MPFLERSTNRHLRTHHSHQQSLEHCAIIFLVAHSQWALLWFQPSILASSSSGRSIECMNSPLFVGACLACNSFESSRKVWHHMNCNQINCWATRNLQVRCTWYSHSCMPDGVLYIFELYMINCPWWCTPWSRRWCNRNPDYIVERTWLLERHSSWWLIVGEFIHYYFLGWDWLL